MDLRGRRSGVRCVLSLCRAEALVAELLGLLSGAARGRAGRRDAAEIHQKGPSHGPAWLVRKASSRRAMRAAIDPSPHERTCASPAVPTRRSCSRRHPRSTEVRGRLVEDSQGHRAPP
jgi:hypothetical protein